MKIDQSRTGNNFDALRLLLASMVIVSHGAELVTGDRSKELLTQIFHTISFGELAVDGFFILSGYLIAKSWLKRHDLMEFAVNRATRIIPGFVIAFLLSTLVFPLVATPASQLFQHFGWKSWVIDLLTLTGPNSPAPYGPHPYPWPNGSLWTIRWEVLCYIMIAVLGLTKLLTSKKAVLGCFLASLALLGFEFGRHGDEIYNGIFRLLPYYLAGTLFNAYEGQIPYPKWWPIPAALGFVLCLLKHKLALLALPIVLAYGLFGVAQVSNPFRPWLSRRPDISYGTYLYGWPVIKIVVYLEPSLPIPFVILESLFLALGAGFLSWHLVEKWPMELRKRFKNSTVQRLI